MNKWHEDEGGIESEKIFFDKIEIKDDTVLVKPTKFYVEIGRTSDDVLQDYLLSMKNMECFFQYVVRVIKQEWFYTIYQMKVLKQLWNQI